jgi:hypothetical protein
MAAIVNTATTKYVPITEPFLNATGVNLDWPKATESQDTNETENALILVAIGCNLLNTPIEVFFKEQTITGSVNIIKENNTKTISIKPDTEDTIFKKAKVSDDMTKITLDIDDKTVIFTVWWWNKYHATVTPKKYTEKGEIPCSQD